MSFERISKGERIFKGVNNVLLVLFSLVIIMPFWTVIMNSFVSEAEIMRRGVFIFFPEEWNFDAYEIMLGPGSNIYRAYGNTIFVVSVGTVLNLIFTITLAYGLSKRRFKGRGIITGLIFFTMIFNGGMIPTFMLVKSLGMLNSRTALIFPGLIGTWNMFIMRNFFYAIPESLEEAAFIDGANPFQTLVLIILPLSMTAIATIGLFYAVGHWNAWFGALIYINDSAKLPVQNILRNIIAASNMSEVDSYLYDSMRTPPPSQAIRAAAVMICTVPILVIYPFIQKYFVKGVMVGSIKG
jgi:putative aldouronate transport system permease protein